MRALALLLISLVPSTALAQEPIARPNFEMSNVLHVVAVAVGVVGTATATVSGRLAEDCSDPRSPCSAEPWSWLALVGGVLVVVSIVLGISATQLHFQTRNELAAQVAVLPWIDSHGLGIRW